MWYQIEIQAYLRMRGTLRGQPRSVVRTLFLEDTYRATGLCAAIGARLAAEGMEPDVFRAAQMPDPQAFMRHFLAQGYVVTGSNKGGFFNKEGSF